MLLREKAQVIQLIIGQSGKDFLGLGILAAGRGHLVEAVSVSLSLDRLQQARSQRFPDVSHGQLLSSLLDSVPSDSVFLQKLVVVLDFKPQLVFSLLLGEPQQGRLQGGIIRG